MEAVADVAELYRIIHDYTVFFLLFDVVFFVVIVLLLVLSIKYIKSHKDFRLSRQYSSYIIQGQEEERAHVSRELHDGVAQDLRYCKGLAEKLEDGEAKAQITAILESTIQEVRAVSYMLAPPDVTEGNFITNIQGLCQKFAERSGVEFRLTVPEGTDASFLTAHETLNLYRIVQESLTNIAKHAQASEVTVLVRNQSATEEPGLYILITDDGIGFDASHTGQHAAQPAHYGIVSMEERARLIGARLYIKSSPGEGTQVSVTKPLT